MNIFGKYFEDNEKVLKSLTKIYGLGRKTVKELGLTFGLGYNNKVKDISKETWSRIIQAIELGPKKYSTVPNKSLTQILTENRAQTVIRENIDLEKKIKSYRGLRHLEGLPCRGQRTHTNALTARKKRITRTQLR